MLFLEFPNRGLERPGRRHRVFAYNERHMSFVM